MSISRKEVVSILAPVIGVTISVKKLHHHEPRVVAVRMAHAAAEHEDQIAVLPERMKAELSAKAPLGALVNGKPMTAEEVKVAVPCCTPTRMKLAMVDDVEVEVHDPQPDDAIEVDSHKPLTIGPNEILLGDAWIDPSSGARCWQSMTVDAFHAKFGGAAAFTHAGLVAEDPSFAQTFDDWRDRGIIT